MASSAEKPIFQLVAEACGLFTSVPASCALVYDSCDIYDGMNFSDPHFDMVLEFNRTKSSTRIWLRFYLGDYLNIVFHVFFLNYFNKIYITSLLGDKIGFRSTDC